MDGLEATRKLREVEKALNEANGSELHHQFVIAFSANSDSETIKEAFSAGVDEFIPKPFSIQTFNEAIQRLRQVRN